MAFTFKAFALSVLMTVMASCHSGEAGRFCNISSIDEGYSSLPVDLRWTGGEFDDPLIFRKGCDKPLEGVILSRQTKDFLRNSVFKDKVYVDENNLSASVEVYIYFSKSFEDSKIFIVDVSRSELKRGPADQPGN